jgi:hypothetical protein
MAQGAIPLPSPIRKGSFLSELRFQGKQGETSLLKEKCAQLLSMPHFFYLLSAEIILLRMKKGACCSRPFSALRPFFAFDQGTEHLSIWIVELTVLLQRKSQ